MLKKKKDIFFQTFEDIADNLHEAASYFANGIKNLDNLGEFAKQMKVYETKGDQYTHTIIIALHKTFITPIEREDILALTSSLDDVLDGIEACAARLDMYQIREHDEYMVLFTENLTKSTQQINEAIRLLTSKKYQKIREFSVRINELENQGDDLLRSGIKNLFANVKDPIDLIKKKELYEMLESTTDDCEDVANTLETIIMRNS